MSQRALFVFLSLLLSEGTAFSQNQVVGRWLSEDREATTEIYAQDGEYFGKIIALEHPDDERGVAFTDTENPDPSRRKQALLGLALLKHLQYQPPMWKHGTIYDPSNGKTYTCTLWLTDSNTLKVRGYWGPFYETQIWTRTQ